MNTDMMMGVGTDNVSPVSTHRSHRIVWRRNIADRDYRLFLDEHDNLFFQALSYDGENLLEWKEWVKPSKMSESGRVSESVIMEFIEKADEVFDKEEYGG